MRENNKLTVGILAHVDAGKTTLSESILYTCGAIRKMGRVDHGDAFLDTFELSPEFSMAEFKIPDSWVGKTLRDLKIREKNKINLVGLKQGNDVDINPNPAEPLPADCTVMAIGKNEDLNKVSGN